MTEKIPMYLKLAHAIVGDGSSSTNEFILAELAIRQYEEIERLRAWQTKAVEDFTELHKELNEAYDRAAEICENYPRYNWGSENAGTDHVQKEWGINLGKRIRALKRALKTTNG